MPTFALTCPSAGTGSCCGTQVRIDGDGPARRLADPQAEHYSLFLSILQPVHSWIQIHQGSIELDQRLSALFHVPPSPREDVLRRPELYAMSLCLKYPPPHFTQDIRLRGTPGPALSSGSSGMRSMSH
jgi:hypothetical protein